MFRRVLGLIAAILLSLSIAPAAQASTPLPLAVCVGTSTWTFDPPVEFGMQETKIRIKAQYGLCVQPFEPWFSGSVDQEVGPVSINCTFAGGSLESLGQFKVKWSNGQVSVLDAALFEGTITAVPAQFTYSGRVLSGRFEGKRFTDSGQKVSGLDQNCVSGITTFSGPSEFTILPID